jgi:hypothetical protein
MVTRAIYCIVLLGLSPTLAFAQEPDPLTPATPQPNVGGTPPLEAPNTPPSVPSSNAAPTDATPAEQLNNNTSKEAPSNTTSNMPFAFKDRANGGYADTLWGSALRVVPHVSVYAEYVLSIRQEDGETDWFHSFELPRAHASLFASYDIAEARIILEAVRSAAEGALLGVAGDSLVMRLREAWGGFTAWKHLEVRFGLIPTLTLPVFEELLHLRPLAPSAPERTGFASPADLGATVRGILPGGYGFIATGFYNGEGYRQRELNRGKNIEIAGEFHPLAAFDDVAPLAIFGSYVSGSSGTALGRADRIHAGIGWFGDVIRGGVGMTYALGTTVDPAASSVVGTAAIRVIPIERLVFAADAMLWQRNLDTSSDWLFAGTVGGGYAFVDPILPMLAVDFYQYGDGVSLGAAPQDDLRIRAIGAVTF